MKEVVDYKTPTKKESKAVELINIKLKKSASENDIKIGLTNYGPCLLFKFEEEKSGQNIIKINREHKAYKIWSQTKLGKKYYTIIMYTLRETTKKMSNREAAKFLTDFSEFLGKKSSELLSK